MFKGFASPTTVDTPLEFFDLALRLIDNLPEMRVVGYVVRRTLAFEKPMDWISLSQFEHGVTAKDGHPIDYGVNLPRKSIIAGLKRAVAHGWLVKNIRCPDCNSEVVQLRRENRKPHQSEFVVPTHCPKCKHVLRGRERIYYGLHWESPQDRSGVVTQRNYPMARGSYRALLGVVTPGNPQTKKYQYDKNGVFAFLSKTFAELIGVESYELTRHDQERTLSLLQEGYTSDDIAAVMRQMIAARKGTQNKIKSLSYVLRGVRHQKTRPPQPTVNAKDAIVTGSQPPAEDALTVIGNQPSAVNAPAGPVNATFSLEVYAQGDPAFLTLLQRVQRMNAKPLNEEHVRLWRALCREPWVSDLAQKFKIASGALLVLEAVDAAIASGSVREDFLAPSMAEKFLRGWQEHGRNGHRQKPRSPRSSASAASRPTSLQFDSPEAFEKSLEKPGSQV